MSTNRFVDGVRRLAPDSSAVLPLGLTILLFAALPFHWHLALGPASVNMSYGDVVVAAVGALWLAGLLGPRRLPKYSLAIAAFLGTAVLSLLVAAAVGRPYFSATAGVVTLVKFVGSVAWAAAAFALARGRVRRVVPIGAAVSVVVALAFAGWTVYAAVVWDLVRVEGPFNNPNLYGQYLVCNACLALYCYESWRGTVWAPLRWCCALTVPVFVTAVVTTGSRGAILGIVGAAATILVLSYRRIGAARLVAGLVTFAAALGAVLWRLAERDVFFLEHLRGRLFKDVDSRLAMWRASLEALRSSPILGIGYGQVPPLLALELGKEAVAHNVYVTIAAETGLLGLAIFAGLLGWLFVDSWRLSASVPAVVFLAAIVGGTALQGVGTDVDNFRTLWIAIGLVAAYEAEARDSDVTVGELLGSIRERAASVGD